MNKYHITYDVTPIGPDGITKEEIPEGRGACDAVLLASIIYPEDGSLSVAVVSVDGRTNQDLTATEIFKVWVLLANRLSADKKLGEGARRMCSLVDLMVKTAMEGEHKEVKVE